MSALGTGARRLAVRLTDIRVRLTLWYVVLLALILVGFSAFLYLRLAQALGAETDRALAAEAQRVIATLDVQNGQPGFGDALDQLPAGTVIVLYNAAGQRLDATDTRQSLPALPVTVRAAATGVTSVQTAPAADGEDWRVRTQPVVDGGHLVAILQVAASEQQTEGALGQLAVLMGIGIPLTLVLASVGGVFLAGRALAPVDRITRAVQRMGAEDLSQRLRLPPRRDEVGRLATTFNGLLARLDQAFARQRQFTADASHELRTPLALLTSQAELALERPRKATEYRLALEGIRAEAQRMARLLGELLTLARADSGREPIAREPVALDELVGDVVAALEPLAAGRGVRLAAERSVAVAPSVVLGDQTRLTQLLVNLIDNAIKYTPAGGVVTVSLRQQDGLALLRVADTGVGIAPEHLPHLFERFYRVDTARAQADGGAGLGLAIAQWVAQAHGGTIEAASTLGAGTAFTVRLPRTRVEGGA